MKPSVLVLTAVLAAGSVQPKPAYSASEDACAIWLCITVGFAVSGCSGARKEMFKRISEFKSPLPAWSSCSADKSDEKGLRPHSQLWAIVDDWSLGPAKVEGFLCGDLYGDGFDAQIAGTQCKHNVRETWITQHGEILGDKYAFIIWTDTEIDLSLYPTVTPDMLTRDGNGYCFYFPVEPICNRDDQ